MKTTYMFAMTLLLLSFTSLTEVLAGDRYAYKVANIGATDVLNVRQHPSSRAAVILQLPADARWILKRTAQHQGRWQKVVWGVKEGWVYDYYLSGDNKASQVLAEHRQCVTQNPENAMCCGFNVPQKSRDNTQIIETFMVVKVPGGQSLNVRSSGSPSAQKIASIPHNATGIVKFPGKRIRNNHGVWQKIRWNGRNGWVNAAYLKYDPITSDYRNIVQHVCSSNRI